MFFRADIPAEYCPVFIFEGRYPNKILSDVQIVFEIDIMDNDYFWLDCKWTKP